MHAEAEAPCAETTPPCAAGMKWGSQIRSITVPFSEARGPTNARHLAATLYRNEDYFFQIDSHSTFRQARPHVHVYLYSQCSLT